MILISSSDKEMQDSNKITLSEVIYRNTIWIYEIIMHLYLRCVINTQNTYKNIKKQISKGMMWIYLLKQAIDYNLMIIIKISKSMKVLFFIFIENPI